MKDFLFLFHGGDLPEETSPEQMQAHMSEWGIWMKKMSEKGQFVGGEPLAKEGNWVSSENGIKVDAVTPESKELVGGYVIVRATDLQEATEISKDCPSLKTGGKVQVREITPIDL